MRAILLLLISTFIFIGTNNAQIKKIGEIQAANGEPSVFSIDPSNRYITLGNETGILSVYDASTNQEIYKVRPHQERISYLEYYNSGQEVITATSSEIIFSKITDGTQVSSIKVFHDIERMALDHSSNQLFIVGRLKNDETMLKQLFKVDLKSRRFEPIYNGAGIDDLAVSGDGKYLFFSKGSKINLFDVELNQVETTLKGDEGGVMLDHNHGLTDWIVSYEKVIVRFWKISSARNYELRWDAMSTIEDSDRIHHAWILNDENRLLFYGTKGLKVRDVKNPNGGITIKSATGLEIENVSLSADRSKILFLIHPNTVEIWNASESGVVAASQPVASATTGTSKVSVADADDQIYQKYREEIDKELNLRSELFAPRGEFERSSDYDARLIEAENYKKNVFDYYKGKANREAEVAKELERARLKILADKKREDSLRKVSLYKDKIVASYKEFYTRISSVGTYDPDKERFPVTIDEMTHIVPVPFNKAREFKEGYLYYKVVGAKQLLQDGFTEEKFNYRIITDNGRVYDFGKQRKPLFVSDEYKLFKEATNRNNPVTSTPSVPVQSPVNVSSKGPTNATDLSIYNYFRKKNYHALLIGVNNYSDYRINQLDGPINDAQRLKDVLSNEYTFDDENITFLQNPTRTEIIETFDRLQRQIGEEDNLLVFYAGHGIWDENLKQGFWLPSDSKIDSKAAWLSNAMIRDYIGGINAKHTLLVADACFSGGIFKTREVFVQNRASLELAKLPSRKAITSGAMKTVPDKSVFIEYLIKRLQQNEFSLLPTEQLFTSFKIAVMNNSEGQVPQYGDIQGAGDEGGDFVFVRRDQ